MKVMVYWKKNLWQWFEDVQSIQSVIIDKGSNLEPDPHVGLEIQTFKNNMTIPDPHGAKIVLPYQILIFEAHQCLIETIARHLKPLYNSHAGEKQFFLTLKEGKKDA